MPAVLLVSRDLLFSSRVEGAARQHGARCVTAADTAEAAARIAEEPPALVLCDLTAPVDVEEIVGAARSANCEVTPPVIAFGPHVQTARLDEARAAGCDQVLTRNRFNSMLDELVRRHIGAASAD